MAPVGPSSQRLDRVRSAVDAHDLLDGGAHAAGGDVPAEGQPLVEGVDVHLVEVRRVGHRRALARPLGRVHGEVGLLEQRVDVAGIRRRLDRRTADADPHRYLPAPDRDRLGELGLHAVGEGRGVAVVLQQHRELVTAEAGHGVAGAHHRPQPLGHRHEQLVTGRVPQGVVDGLEVVQVAEQDRQCPAVTLVQLHGVLHPVVEQRAIGQTGQGVMERPVAQLRLAGLQAEQQPAVVEDGHQLPRQQGEQHAAGHPEQDAVAPFLAEPGADHGDAGQGEHVRQGHRERRLDPWRRHVVVDRRDGGQAHQDEGGQPADVHDRAGAVGADGREVGEAAVRAGHCGQPSRQQPGGARPSVRDHQHGRGEQDYVRGRVGQAHHEAERAVRPGVVDAAQAGRPAEHEQRGGDQSAVQQATDPAAAQVHRGRADQDARQRQGGEQQETDISQRRKRRLLGVDDLVVRPQHFPR
jgi:hypothetical protein